VATIDADRYSFCEIRIRVGRHSFHGRTGEIDRDVVAADGDDRGVERAWRGEAINAWGDARGARDYQSGSELDCRRRR
jgi:hypothetical protein